jgi:hypothetical protein
MLSALKPLIAAAAVVENVGQGDCRLVMFEPA